MNLASLRLCPVVRRRRAYYAGRLGGLGPFGEDEVDTAAHEASIVVPVGAAEIFNFAPFFKRQIDTYIAAAGHDYFNGACRRRRCKRPPQQIQHMSHQVSGGSSRSDRKQRMNVGRITNENR